MIICRLFASFLPWFLLISTPSHAFADATPLLVPVTAKADLQRLLDENRVVRLEPNADYRTGGVTQLVMRTSQSIEGGWNTRVPKIVIPAGESHISIKNVWGNAPGFDDVEFLGGSGQESNDIIIVGGEYGATHHLRVRIGDGARVNRLRLTNFGGLQVDQGVGGYVRDSVFTRLLGRWEGPHVYWKGNRIEPSRGNAFLGINNVAPLHGSVWDDAGELWLIGADAESWNPNGSGSSVPFILRGISKAFVIGLSGGTANPQFAGSLASIQNSAILGLWFLHGRGRPDAPAVGLSNASNAVVVQREPLSTIWSYDDPTGMNRAELVPQVSAGLPNAYGLPLASAGSTKTSVDRLMETFLTAGKMTTPPKPFRRLVRDALGPDWKIGLAGKPSSNTLIQSLINQYGVAKIPAGIYYLDRPLRIGSASRAEGIIGADKDAVYLVSKGNFPVIEGRGDHRYATTGSPVSQQIVLENLTIYGGTFGINWTSDGTNIGDAGQIFSSSFSNLKFMKQTVAGVRAQGIFGIDASTWRSVDFSQMPTGILGFGRGVSGGMNYADKLLFLDCQFQDLSGSAWEWDTERPSGGHVWKDCLFSNVGGISRTRSSNNVIWANSVFEDIRGQRGLSFLDTDTTRTWYFIMVDCQFKGSGPSAVTDTASLGVGTLFIDTEFGQTSGTIVPDLPGQTLLAWNSYISGGANPGRVTQGITINSRLRQYDRLLQLVQDGVVTNLSPSLSAPRRQVMAR